MKYRNIPGIDTPISEVGFGVWSVATPWWGVRDDKLGKRLLRAAYEEYGITFFDTGDVYGQGKGETMLAEALEGLRDKVVIATKFGYDIYAKRGDRHGGHSELPQYWDPDFHPEGVRRKPQTPEDGHHRPLPDAQRPDGSHPE